MPTKTTCLGAKKYASVIFNDYSRVTWILILASKYEAIVKFYIIKSFKREMSRHQ